MPKSKNITFGDIHDINGEILYFKNDSIILTKLFVSNNKL